LIKGLVKNTKCSIFTLFIGPEESAYQFAHLVYSEIEEMLPLGKFLLCQIDPSHLPHVEITVVNAKGSLIDRLLKAGYLLLPNVSFSLNLHGSTDQIINRSHRRRRSIKKLQSFNYYYAITRNNEEDFAFFYWKMYLPYAKKRFGRAVQLYNYSRLKAVYRGNGGIVFVKKEEKHIVGILFQIRGKTLYANSFGVYEANKSFVTDLAGQAALLFLIKWAKTKGMKSLNYGKTMPFLRDGVFTYKKEWGMHIEQHADQRFCALRLNCRNEDVLSFLRQNPFMFVDKGAMKGFVLVNHKPTKLELQRIFSKHFVPGLNSPIIIAYHNHDTEITSKTEFSTRFNDFTDTLLRPLSSIYILCRNKALL
jgi:hypothetical protein